MYIYILYYIYYICLYIFCIYIFCIYIYIIYYIYYILYIYYIIYIIYILYIYYIIYIYYTIYYIYNYISWKHQSESRLRLIETIHMPPSDHFRTSVDFQGIGHHFLVVVWTLSPSKHLARRHPKWCVLLSKTMLQYVAPRDSCGPYYKLKQIIPPPLTVCELPGSGKASTRSFWRRDVFENTRHGPAMIHCQSQQIVLLLFFFRSCAKEQVSSFEEEPLEGQLLGNLAFCSCVWRNLEVWRPFCFFSLSFYCNLQLFGNTAMTSHHRRQHTYVESGPGQDSTERQEPFQAQSQFWSGCAWSFYWNRLKSDKQLDLVWCISVESKKLESTRVWNWRLEINIQITETRVVKELVQRQLVVFAQLSLPSLPSLPQENCLNGKVAAS